MIPLFQILKYNFVPPSLVEGKAFRAHAPIAAIPTACAKVVRPVGVLTSACALADNCFKAKLYEGLEPSAKSRTVRPLPPFRSSRMLKPAAIPVMLGCGVTIRFLAIFLLGLLRRVKARRAVLRT